VEFALCCSKRVDYYLRFTYEVVSFVGLSGIDPHSCFRIIISCLEAHLIIGSSTSIFISVFVALGAEVPEMVFILPIIAESASFWRIYSLPREGRTEFGNTVATNLSGGIRRKLGVFSYAFCQRMPSVATGWYQGTLHDRFDVFQMRQIIKGVRLASFRPPKWLPIWTHRSINFSWLIGRSIIANGWVCRNCCVCCQFAAMATKIMRLCAIPIKGSCKNIKINYILRYWLI